MAERDFRATFRNIFFKGDEEEKESKTSSSDSSDLDEMSDVEFGYDGTTSDDAIQSRAQRFITDALALFDTTNFIGQVQEVIEMVGEKAEPVVIQKVLARITGCKDLDLIREDGLARIEAIKEAIAKAKEQSEGYRKIRTEKEEAFKKAEKEAESEFTSKVNSANQECELAIEEERKRCELAIQEIRKKAEETIENAKEQRDETLGSVMMERHLYEDGMREAEMVADETAKLGNSQIENINGWLRALS